MNQNTRDKLIYGVVLAAAVGIAVAIMAFATLIDRVTL